MSVNSDRTHTGAISRKDMEMVRPLSIEEDSDDSCTSITDILNELEEEERYSGEMGQKQSSVEVVEAVREDVISEYDVKKVISDDAQKVVKRNKVKRKSLKVPEESIQSVAQDDSAPNPPKRKSTKTSMPIIPSLPVDEETPTIKNVLNQETIITKEEIVPEIKSETSPSGVTPEPPDSRLVQKQRHAKDYQILGDGQDSNGDTIPLKNNITDSSNETVSTKYDVTSHSANSDSTPNYNEPNECRSESESANDEDYMDAVPVQAINPVTLNEKEADDEDLTDAINRRPSNDSINQFLDSSCEEAEARLLAKRAARAEAREIRMRDLERQQREQEENADRQFDMLAEPIIRRPASTSRYLSSRRSSEDSLEDTGSLRDLREEEKYLNPEVPLQIKHELKEVEEKFRKAMIANAQLDNDKAAQTYQLELLKDRLEESEENYSQLKREHREKSRDYEQLKRLTVKLKEDLSFVKAELDERDRLITEKGLVIVGEEEPVNEENGEGLTNGPTRIRRALVSAENAQFLENAGEGSLDVRLARFAKERGELQDLVSHLKLELEEERSKRRKHSGVTANGPSFDSDYDAADIQREASKQLAEFKFRAQKAEQDVATLQATVARLESQVIRYKSAAEISEKSEEALKAEKRKLQREAREAQSRAEELEMSNSHLIKRLDKLKNAKSALLKEL